MQPERLGITSQPPIRHTVLLVDDEPTVLRLFSGFVTALGHVAKTALSAEEALAVLTSSEGADIDAALIDIKMPGKGGEWLIEHLASYYPWIRVIIATGVAELDARVSLKGNVAAYLVKPFTVDDLHAVLD